MNDKILCFKIDGNNLYLEISLIDFNEIPIFFLCRDDNGARYAVQCIDTEDLNYYVIQVSEKNILKLLNNTSTIREFITSSDKKWEIQSRENIEDDIVKQIQMINEEDLVDEGVFLSLNNKEVVAFKEKIKNEVNFGLIKQKYQTAVAAKTKISKSSVSNDKDSYIYNTQLNNFTYLDKMIPFTIKTGSYEKNSNSRISNLMLQPTKNGGYKVSSENLLVKKPLEQELTQITIASQKSPNRFCS